MLNPCTDLRTPVPAHNAQVRKLILRGKKLLIVVHHNFFWAQLRLWFCRREEMKGKSLDLRKKPGGNEK